MTRLFPKLTALMLLVAMLAATASVFAAPVHQVCVSQMHDCEDVPAIIDCCCGTAASGERQAAPPEQRIELPTLAALANPAPMAAAVQLTAPALCLRPTPISPQLSRLDLTTLLRTLLI